ncbi:MAG: glycosyltransferase, partial [Planctomycetota bacterium]
GDNPVTVVVLSSESGVPEFMALLEALALLVAEERSLMAFVSEAAFRSERRSWKTVVRLDLASRICITPDVESRRDLVLSADMAILPDHSGRHRSIALDAMAAGIPLVASPDPAVGWLNPSTCKLIAQASVQGWADAIRELIRSEREAEMLGLSARDHIRAYHLSSTHLHSLIAHYRALVETQSPIAFEQA